MKATFNAGGGANFIGETFHAYKFGDFIIGVDWGGGYGSHYDEPRYSGPPPNILILSHAHFDHIGRVPKFRKKYPGTPIYATEPTKKLSRVTWNQSVRRAEEDKATPPFTGEDVEKTRSSINVLEIGKKLQLTSDLTVRPVYAGHILGSVSLEFFWKGRLIGFATNDICFRDRSLIRGAEKHKFAGGMRFLVRESTYIDKNFEDRSVSEKRLTDLAVETLDGGGKLLIAALSIDRAQDILSVLLKSQEKHSFPIYLDGARAATKVYEEYLPSCRGLLKKLETFRGWRDKEDLLRSKEPAVIVATSGMVIKKTASAWWAGELLFDPKNRIALVSYQDPGEQGYALLNTERGEFLRFNGKIHVKNCQVEQINFSSHMDGRDGEELEERANADTVIYTHGSNKSIELYLAILKAVHRDSRRRVKAEVGKEVEL